MFASGHAADLILSVLVLELVALRIAGHRWSGSIAAVLPGIAFVLALRAALIGAGWWWIALPLAASLPAHLLDLRNRGWLGGEGDRRPS